METIYKQLRQARITAGLTQAALAAQVGCKQSAVSMMEAGRPEALSRESLEKAASILNVTLPTREESTASVSGRMAPAVLGHARVGICTNFNCPSNLPYRVGESVYFMPLGTAGTGEHCVYCGEILQHRCVQCGHEVTTTGGCCGHCGVPWVEFPEDYVQDIAAWIEARIQSLEHLRKIRSSLG